MNRFAHLCEAEHVTILLGTCPWCREPILRGSRRDDGCSHVERFAAWLRSNGIQITEQRLALVKLLATVHGPFDADWLLKQLPSKGEAEYVPRPSVYRTLVELVESGLMSKSEADGRTLYQWEA